MIYEWLYGDFSGYDAHYVVTVSVVLLSIISLIIIMAGGYRDRYFRSIAIWVTIALMLMFAGATGTSIVPPDNFGIPESFRVFSADGFHAILGIHLINSFSHAERMI